MFLQYHQYFQYDATPFRHQLVSENLGGFYLEIDLTLHTAVRHKVC